MTDIKEKLENAIDVLGTTYAGLIVNPKLKDLNHRLERKFFSREIDYEASDLTRELAEIEDVKKLLNEAISGTIGILEETLKLEVPYTQTVDGLQYAVVKGLAENFIASVNT